MSDRAALNALLKSPITHEMVQYVVNKSLKVVQCKRSKTITILSPTSSEDGRQTTVVPLPSLMTFISRLIRYSNVSTGVFLTTLVYLQRVSTVLTPQSEGAPCTLHRVFLAALIISSKYHSDVKTLNSYWTKCTDGLFYLRDINLMESQLLELLNWDTSVTELDLIRSLDRKFLDPIKWNLQQQEFRRRMLAEFNIKQQQQQQQQHIKRQTSGVLLSPLKPSQGSYNNQFTAGSPTKSTKKQQAVYPCPKLVNVTTSQAPAFHLPQHKPTQAAVYYNNHQLQQQLSSGEETSNQQYHSRSSSLNSTFSVQSSSSSLSSVSPEPQHEMTKPTPNSYNMGYNFPQEIFSHNLQNSFMQKSVGGHDMDKIVDGSKKLLELPAYSFKFN
ncbi:hypothetical protein WICPIJ_004952 [Wickerhamomyces pijperi]|uniref:Cyclin N-terminal domain-containing protein n=1 Tax=Wickerhamomyces pijperi TaxID=599730 RepID=A0A9P8Q4F9_WICPI|nr:hypothetical protein WICPIJ_004952 [Wickerhamomyces pijperi]